MSIFSKVFIFCIFLAIFCSAYLSSFYVVVLVLLLCLVIVSDTHKFLQEKRNIGLRRIALIYFIYLLLNSFSNSEMNDWQKGLYITTEFLISYILIDIMLEHKYDNKSIMFFGLLSLTYIILASSFAFFSSDFELYSFIFKNKNFFGATVLFLYGSLIPIMEDMKKYKYFLINIMIVFLLYISGARSCLFVFSIYICSKSLVTNSLTKYFKGYFILSILLSSIFIYFYMDITIFDSFDILNEFSIKQTGSQLASGRNIIWSEMFNSLLINDGYFFGLGSGARYTNLNEVNLSIHNLYLQVLMQNGVFGLVLFLTFIFQLFKTINRKVNVNSVVQKNIFFFLFLLIIQQNFEVFLFQNNMLFTYIFIFLFPILNYEKRNRIMG